MNPDTVPDHYCQNLADRPGSDFHYSLLGLAEADFQTLVTPPSSLTAP